MRLRTRREAAGGQGPSRLAPPPPQGEGKAADGPTLGALFLSFLTIGSTSFGGGLLGWIRRELVERRRWIDDQQFLASYGLSQIVPGATNVNLSVIIGSQLRGVPGAIAAIAGLLLVPLALLLALGTLYFASRGISGSHIINAALAGAGAAAIGFNLATGLRLGYRNIRRLGPALIAGAIVIGIGILRIPLLEVLLVMLPVSLAVTLAERLR
ncbi:MAG TPA: chromate transporter [Acetobacteraceae bacterium]|nr:chromate transporter [Acetobacteraceae bacterium]